MRKVLILLYSANRNHPGNTKHAAMRRFMYTRMCVHVCAHILALVWVVVPCVVVHCAVLNCVGFIGFD